MRLPAIFLAAALSTLPVVASAQGQQQAAAPPSPPETAQGRPVYDIVAADRETAWRINVVTGEVTVCRVDTARVDSVSARCAPATMPGATPQQSQVPGGAARP